MMGMQIVVVPDSHFPQEHYASAVHIYSWHPFWPWLYRLIGLNPAKCFDVLPGRPYYRAMRQYYIAGDRIVCTARGKAELLRAMDARGLAPGQYIAPQPDLSMFQMR